MAIITTIVARKRNNYSIARVSQTDGTIIITQQEVRTSILADKNLFLMDYASELEECYPEVQIKICSPEEAQKAVVSMKMFKEATGIDESLVNGFNNCQNHWYRPFTKQILLNQGRHEEFFEVEVQRIAPDSTVSSC